MKTETSSYEIRKYDLYIANKITGELEKWIQLGVYHQEDYDYLSDPYGAPVYYGKIMHRSKNYLASGEKPIKVIRCIKTFPLERNSPDIPFVLLKQVHTEQSLVLLQKEWEDINLSEVFAFKECESLKEALKFIINWDNLTDGEDLILKEYLQTVETIRKTWEREIT